MYLYSEKCQRTGHFGRVHGNKKAPLACGTEHRLMGKAASVPESTKSKVREQEVGVAHNLYNPSQTPCSPQKYPVLSAAAAQTLEKTLTFPVALHNKLQ